MSIDDFMRGGDELAERICQLIAESGLESQAQGYALGMATADWVVAHSQGDLEKVVQALGVSQHGVLHGVFGHLFDKSV